MLIDGESDGGNHSLDVYQVNSRNEGFKRISELVNQLSNPRSGGLKPSQIAVLVPGYPVNDWPARFKKISVVRDLDAMAQ